MTVDPLNDGPTHQLDFARRKQGVIIAGNSGPGKSHLAKALLLIGCQKTFRCRYVTATTMLQALLASLADNTLRTPYLCEDKLTPSGLP
jgi:DNA replication protein DnaC